MKLFGSDVSSKRAALFGKSRAKTTDKQTRALRYAFSRDDDDDAFVLHDSEEGIERIHE